MKQKIVKDEACETNEQKAFRYLQRCVDEYVVDLKSKKIIGDIHMHELASIVGMAIAEEREASGWVSVEDRLPVCEFENTELGVMVSQTVNIYGVSVDDNHGEGFGELHSDGRWVCYGGEHDFMNVKEVTHWSPLRAAPKDEVSE